MTMGEYIKQLRREHGWTMEELGKKVGVNRAAVQKWENGTVENIKRSTIKELSRVFGVSPCDLMCWDEVEPPAEQDPIISAVIKSGQLHPDPEYQAYPMYGTIACGQPILSDDNVEDMPLLPRVRTADFVLRCQGDSMIDANIFDGDYVYIHRQPDVDNGTIAAVAIDGEITLKRVIRQQGCVLLQPCNNRYAAALYTPDNCDDIHIVGKAVGEYSDLDGR